VRLSHSLFALLACAVPAAAQETQSTFYLIVANDTLTVERVWRSPAKLDFQLFDRRGGTRVDFRGVTGNGALLENVMWRGFSERDSVNAVTVTARFIGDSVGITRGSATNWLRVGPGALPSMNVSAALLEQSLMRARAVGGDSVAIPLMFLPNGPSVPVTIAKRGADSATVRIGGVAIQATIGPDGMLLGAVIPSQGARYVRGAALLSDPAPVKNYGPPPGAPYTAQDVTIRTLAGLTLRGTLTLPQRVAGTRLPAIVTISGSGTQDRDAAVTGLKAYRPFYQFADTLGRRGIAVLRLDDRGGGSDAGPPTVTTADLADDTRAAVAYLRTRAEIDPRRIGLVGHSEGGTIGPMVASTDTAIAAVVIMGGSVSKGRELLAFQQRYVVDSLAHLLGQQRDAALARYARSTDSMAAAMPWMKFFIDYDGRPAAGRTRAPVLILHGEKDYQVPVAEAEKTATAVRAGGNRDVTVRVFPATNHLFLPHANVGFSYEKLPSFTVKSEVLGAIADWLTARLTR
jgi:dienelactone hydrolase